MTVKDIQQQIASYSTEELHLIELAAYRELEKRGALPETHVSPELLQHLKELRDGIKKGTVKTLTEEEYRTQMASWRAKKA